MAITSRGHLNPGAAGVRFDRFDLDLDEVVRHVWVVRWKLAYGEVRRERVLTYPACNVVIGPDDAQLFGPARSVLSRELSGDSWAVGVLLRPAATTLLTETPAERLVGTSEPLPRAPQADVREAMARPTSADLDQVREVLQRWFAPLASLIDPAGRLANEACHLVESRPDLLRVEDLAAELAMSVRSLTRCVKRATGLTPKWLIECRRLQAAATTLFQRPETDLSRLAAELGYVDQPHFTHRYRLVVGETPDATRRSGRDARVEG